MGLKLYLNILGVLSALVGISLYLYPHLDVDWQALLQPLFQQSAQSPMEMTSQLTMDTISAEYRKGCPAHKYGSISLLSRSPQFIIIENFVTPIEAEFLIKTAYPPIPLSSLPFSHPKALLIRLVTPYSQNPRLCNLSRAPKSNAIHGVHISPSRKTSQTKT